MKTNFLVRVALFLAIAVAAVAHGTAEPEKAHAATYELSLDTPSGDRYVIDHDLSADDCFAAMWDAENPERDRLACQTTTD